MKVFIIADAHFPFHSKKAYEKVMAALKKEKPDAVVQIGDLLDQYVFSKYSRSSKVTVQDDIKKGLSLAAQMWKDISKALPKAKLYQILGNHDMRMSKRVSELLPELSEVFSPTSIYKFKNVKVMQSDRDFLVLDGVTYCHGWLSRSIDHAKHFNAPTVHGHRHRPTIEVDGSLWSMDVGFMADEKSLPLSYTASKYSRWRMAYGIVENKLPRLTLL